MEGDEILVVALQALTETDTDFEVLSNEDGLFLHNPTS